MSKIEEKPPVRKRRPRTVHEALLAAQESLRRDIETLSKEELVEKLTTYEPGIPHYWFGRPVEPITKEDLLAYWNGGPEPEIRYKDVSEPEPEFVPAETDRTPLFPK